MKKIITIALALVLVLSLAACGGNSNSGGSSTTPPANSGNNSTSTPPASQGGNETTPSNNGSSDAPGGTSVEWPDNDYTKDIPKPNKGTILSAEESNLGGVYFLIKMDWTFEEAKAYEEQLKAAGIDVYSNGGDESYYNFTATLSDGRGVTMNYGEDVVTGISIVKKS
jgi:ABC-type glycerol-3-phosphate transport system substrate-binding protein